MTEVKPEEQWARSNRDLYSQFRRVQAARYPPREAPLPLSEWFQIHHKNLFGPFIQKEIKQLHIKRMAPTMGPSYQIEFGAFQAFFEEQEH
ncbi:hypothetical protein Taro_000317 [Colocasia esculenta]|uniref:Uncharacterized protein n=1 Tax=Colocasia esculenta TaxID=4460 RepID=A0A843TAF0_COLES|nr:hypothetical protein [Colocasia esculenta]